MDVQIRSVDAARGDEGVHASGPAQVKFTIGLRELSRADAARAGTKAATLGELSQAGFPVPDGFVVTTAAFERFLAHNGSASGRTAVEVEGWALPWDGAPPMGLAAVPYPTDAGWQAGQAVLPEEALRVASASLAETDVASVPTAPS